MDVKDHHYFPDFKKKEITGLDDKNNGVHFPLKKIVICFGVYHPSPFLQSLRL